MRITKRDRSAILRAIMLDVPKIDYNQLARTQALEASKKLLPKVIQDNFEECKSYLRTEGCHYDSIGYVHHYGNRTIANHEVLSPTQVKASLAQHEMLQTLQAELRSSLLLCKTVKHLTERLPKFSKYFPLSPENPSGLLPVASEHDLMKSFEKAGFKFDQTPAAKKAKIAI
jgi:hypothetical protein